MEGLIFGILRYNLRAQVIKELIKPNNKISQLRSVVEAKVEEAEVHDADPGNRIQVDTAMQATDEERQTMQVDEQEKSEKTSEQSKASGASGIGAFMEAQKEDVQGSEALQVDVGVRCEGLQVDAVVQSQEEMQISDLEQVEVGTVLLKRTLLTRPWKLIVKASFSSLFISNLDEQTIAMQRLTCNMQYPKKLNKSIERKSDQAKQENQAPTRTIGCKHSQKSISKIGY